MLSQAHGRAVLRAWTCFFHELGANLRSWNSDCATVFDRAVGNETVPAMVASLDLQDKAVRMEQVPGFRLEQAMAKPPMAVEVATNVSTQTVQMATQPPAPVRMKPAPQRQVIIPKPVFFDVAVFDQVNRPVVNLVEKDFSLFEDGVPQTITSFKRERTPITTVLLLDVSGSISSKLGRIRSAALSIIHQGLPQDEFCIVSFTDKTVVVQDFTTNTTLLEQALDHLSAGGQTALLDSVKETVERTNEKGKYDRKAVVSALRASNLELFAVGFPDGLDGDRLADLRGTHLPKKGQTESGARNLLTELTGISGGRAFFPKQATELIGIASSIALDLSTQYRLGYYSTRAESDGHWRQVHVAINPSQSSNNGLTALTRSGYFAHE